KDGSSLVQGWENSSRQIKIIKTAKAIALFKELIIYYGTYTLSNHFKENNFENFESFKKTLTTKLSRENWLNIGGQLIKKPTVEKLLKNIEADKTQNWEEVHAVYTTEGDQ